MADLEESSNLKTNPNDVKELIQSSGLSVQTRLEQLKSKPVCVNNDEHQKDKRQQEMKEMLLGSSIQERMKQLDSQWSSAKSDAQDTESVLVKIKRDSQGTMIQERMKQLGSQQSSAKSDNQGIEIVKRKKDLQGTLIQERMKQLDSQHSSARSDTQDTESEFIKTKRDSQGIMIQERMKQLDRQQPSAKSDAQDTESELVKPKGDLQGTIIQERMKQLDSQQSNAKSDTQGTDLIKRKKDVQGTIQQRMKQLDSQQSSARSDTQDTNHELVKRKKDVQGTMVQERMKQLDSQQSSAKSDAQDTDSELIKTKKDLPQGTIRERMKQLDTQQSSARSATQDTNHELVKRKKDVQGTMVQERMKRLDSQQSSANSVTQGTELVKTKKDAQFQGIQEKMKQLDSTNRQSSAKCDNQDTDSELVKRKKDFQGTMIQEQMKQLDSQQSGAKSDTQDTDHELVRTKDFPGFQDTELVNKKQQLRTNIQEVIKHQEQQDVSPLKLESPEEECTSDSAYASLRPTRLGACVSSTNNQTNSLSTATCQRSIPAMHESKSVPHILESTSPLPHDIETASVPNKHEKTSILIPTSREYRGATPSESTLETKSNKHGTHKSMTGGFFKIFKKNEQKLLKLAPSQWNQLMVVDCQGTSKYQEIIAPFKSNNSVTISLLIDETSILISGSPHPVKDAYTHLSRHIYGKLHLPERIKMDALRHLYPHLKGDLYEKYQVMVSGIEDGSDAITFEGYFDCIEKAREEINKILMNSLTKVVEISFPVEILVSLKKRLKEEGIQAYLELEPNKSKQCLVICSFERQSHDRAIAIVLKGPIQRSIDVHSVDAIEALSKDLFEKLKNYYYVDISVDTEQRRTIIIKGFCLHDVDIVCEKLEEQFASKEMRFPCTEPQAAYIKHLILDNTEEGRSIIASLPKGTLIDCNKPKRVIITGHNAALQKAHSIFNATLSKVFCECFVYKCPVLFLSHIESSILKPLLDKHLEFEYIKEHLALGGQTARDQDGGFSIFLFSKDSTTFTRVQLALEAVNPETKQFQLPRQAAKDVINNLKPTLQRKHNVLLHESGASSFIIRGLTPQGVQLCWEEIEEEVKSTVTMEKYVPLNTHQIKYLKRKHHKDIQQLRTKCSTIELRSQYREDGGPVVLVKGTIKQVEIVHDILQDMLNNMDLTVEMFSVTCEKKHYGMWTKRWKEIKKEKEDKHDLIVDFMITKQNAASGHVHQADKITVDFEVCGSDSVEVLEVKETFCAQKVEKSTFQLSGEFINAILDAMHQNKLKSLQQLAVMLDIDKQANKAILIYPQGAIENFNSAKEEIQSLIDHKNISKDTTSDEEVVGYVLRSKTLADKHLKTVNSIGSQHHVSIHLLKKPHIGFRLSGSPDAVQTVQSLICEKVFQPIEQSISEVLVNVSYKHGIFFSTRTFTSFESKLQNDLCVLCSYSRQGKKSEAIRSAHIQPSTAANGITFEICIGDIVHEKVDAIVNAANEELKHYGGLAKTIVDTGGPIIQTESDEYIRSNKKLIPGTAVCLGAGRLPCKKVIHAVGPRWNDGQKGEKQTLYSTVYACLQVADKENLCSIALPAISTGIFKVPDSVCAEASMKAVWDFCQTNPTSCVCSIRFILFTQTTVDSFVNIFDSGFFTKCLSQTSAITATTSSPSYTWMMGNDYKSLSSYPSDVAAALTKEYLNDSEGFYECNVNGQVYLIDFASMVQTNLSTYEQQKVLFYGDPIQWSWTDDKNSLIPYKVNDSRAIEEMYQSKKCVEIGIKSEKYKFDFTSMNQINVRSGHKRKIVRNEIPADSVASKQTSQRQLQKSQSFVVLRGPDVTTYPGIKGERPRCEASPDYQESIQWMWTNDYGTLIPYTADDSHAIENMYQTKHTVELELAIETAKDKTNKYKFDFKSMDQVNMKTGSKCKIERKVADPKVKLEVKQKQSIAHKSKEPIESDYVVVLRGPKSKLQLAKLKFEEQIKRSFKVHTISLTHSVSKRDFSNLLKKLLKIAEKCGVTCKYETEVSDKAVKPEAKLKLEGLSSKMEQAVQKIQGEIIKHMSTLVAEPPVIPDEWVEQTHEVELFTVENGSPEWIKVEQKFKATMPNSAIHSMSRIQNKWLWGKYNAHKQLISEKNDGDINEKELFHGTGKNPPKDIYEGEDGFDMRFSKTGMWGIANYFAVNASYSNSYAHPCRDGNLKEMFLVKVLTGDSHNCPSNSSLRMPPLKSTASGDSCSGKVQMRYDTVTGHTGGSQVFMTYDNEKAYPAYLIKY